MPSTLNKPLSGPTGTVLATAPTGGSQRFRILRWLEESISSGELAAGDPIPAERALAAMFGVARNTAAAAVDEAERRHLVVRRAPSSRKRFVPDASFSGFFADTTVVVMGAVNPFDGDDEAPRWTDRFISTALLSKLSRAGKHVMVLSHDALTGRGLETIVASRPAGFVITSTIGEHTLARKAVELCVRNGIPTVVYGDGPELRGLDRVHVDHRAGSRELTEWLISRGRRAIVPFFPTQPDTLWARERLAGYAEAMKAAGLEPRPFVSFDAPDLGDATPAEEQFRIFRALALAKLVELREAGPLDALLCISDHWAKVAISALKAMGVDPGRDVLVAGYDNGDPDPVYDPFEPGKATVTIDKHNELTAAEMADLLVARMEGRLPSAPQCRTHAHELVARNAPDAPRNGASPRGKRKDTP